jgi:hypothetical protein
LEEYLAIKYAQESSQAACYILPPLSSLLFEPEDGNDILLRIYVSFYWIHGVSPPYTEILVDLVLHEYSQISGTHIK